MLEINPNIPTVEINDPLLTKHQVRLYVRREDLNHSLVSGNKLRKLKYNLIEAKETGFKTLLTYGGAYSNHILATAAAGKESNLKTIGIIRGEYTEPLNPTLKDAIDLGMEIHYLDRSMYREKNSPEIIKKLKNEFGNFYLVPEGGSNKLAIPGVKEMIDWEAGLYETICCPVGTGGTLAGLVSGGKTGDSFLGFSALKNAMYLNDEVSQLIQGKPDCEWMIIHDYHFGGYAKAPEALLKFIRAFKSNHGIPLEPIYTGKMLWGIFDLIKKGYFSEFAKILAIHTGGLQGNRGFGLEI